MINKLNSFRDFVLNNIQNKEDQNNAEQGNQKEDDAPNTNANQTIKGSPTQEELWQIYGTVQMFI